MPKRMRTVYSSKARKRPSLSDDSFALSDKSESGRREVFVQRPIKQMRYMKSNLNNELERVLLHNSKELSYSIDHSDFPAFNVGAWPLESPELLMSYPACAFSVPRPLFVANKHSEKIDLCYKRPMNRDYYKIRMKFTRSTYHSALKSNKNIRSSIKDNIYHTSVFDMAERLYMQRDPYFYGSYDYYFTGGNLCILSKQGEIIHAGGQNLQELFASEFPVYNGTDSLRNVACLRMSENCEVFEVQPLITSLSNSRQNCFIARQRNLVTLNCLKGKNEIRTLTKFRTKSSPFISFAQSDRDINNFVMTTMKQHIRLYDLNSSVPALVKLFTISPNSANISWNTIKPWRENTFLYTNEKQFFLVDIRTSPEQWLNEGNFASGGLICNHISAVLPSKFHNLFYIATNHNLMCMDIRWLKKDSSSNPDGAICSWSHQLRYAPLMMDTLRSSQTEFIALSSPIAGDLHICQLSRERNEDNLSLESALHVPKHIYNSKCLPYQPPTLLESYENARLAGKCLRPESNLEARLKCCTTGMKFSNALLTNSECELGLLMTLNSNGDVFAQFLSKRERNETEERCNSPSDEIMAGFESKICMQTQPALNYTEIKNMKGLRKVFLCKGLSSNEKYQEYDEDMDDQYVEAVTSENNAQNPTKVSRSKRFRLGRWQKSLSTLHSYKDALVADLLSIWDIDMEEENNIHLGKLRREVKTDSAVKVEDWLKKNINLDQPHPMVSIPHQEAYTRTSIENYTSQILDSTPTHTQSITIDFKNAVHSTQIVDNSINDSISKNLDTSADVTDILLNDGTKSIVVEKLKRKKANKKHIKGF